MSRSPTTCPGPPHANTIVKKAHQRLYFLRRQKKFGMSSTTFTNFYRCTIESILSGCITAWYGSSSAQDRKELQKVVIVAHSITQTSLPSIDSVYTSHCLGKAASIIKDPMPPWTFSLPPSSFGKKIQKSEVTYQPTQEQLLPCWCQTF